MQILVTGGTGFLGRHLVWRLAGEGHTVLFTGRNRTAASEVLQRTQGKSFFHEIDFGVAPSDSLVRELIEPCDAVIHAAALSAPWGSYEDFYRSNVQSTREIVNACNIHRTTRLVHISSPTIYCERRDRFDVQEDDILPRPMTWYARTKREAEDLIREQATVETVILRPRAIYGAWDTVLLPRLLRAARGRAVPLVRQGGALLDITYVDNVVDAVLLALHKPLVKRYREYNVTNGEPLTFKVLLDEISEMFQVSIPTRSARYELLDLVAWGAEVFARLRGGDEPIITRYSAALLSFSQTLSIDRIQRELAYQPKVGNREGLLRHSKWWHEQQRTANRPNERLDS